MATLKNEIKYSCFNDCKQSGCPSHLMTLSIQNTSEILIVEIDGKHWLSADPSQWEALKTMLGEIDYNQFDLSNPLNN